MFKKITNSDSVGVDSVCNILYVTTRKGVNQLCFENICENYYFSKNRWNVAFVGTEWKIGIDSNLLHDVNLTKTTKQIIPLSEQIILSKILS